MGLHGWVGAEDTVLQKYADACLRAAEDDKVFEKFKQDEGYRPILEGGPRLFYDTYLEDIREHNNSSIFFSNLEKFRINDSVGEPDLFESPDIGKFSGTTIKFSHNTIDILEFIKDHGDIDLLVENKDEIIYISNAKPIYNEGRQWRLYWLYV